MSGAEGIAGLALSAVSVAALFTTCIQCFDIVVAGKNFSEDYEQLCALFSLQRARFGLWGESVGLIPSPNSHPRLTYNEQLNRSDIRSCVERTLNNIKSLLDEASQIDERYGLNSAAQSSEIASPRGLDIFRTPFERFKTDIKRHQKKTSAWKVTRWAVHDVEKFEKLIGRLKEFVDGLESITKSLGLLKQQHAKLLQEIESISDAEGLRLLRDASSRHGTSDRDISDTASRRLISVVGSIVDRQSSSVKQSTAYTFSSARSLPYAVAGASSTFLPVPGSWPDDSSSNLESNPKGTPQSQRAGASKNIARVCQQCLEERCKCMPSATLSDSCVRCAQLGKDCSFATEDDMAARGDIIATDSVVQTASTTTSQLPETPQNQRLVNELITKTKPRPPQSFAAGDTQYGRILAPIKRVDEKYWIRKSATFLSHAQSSSSAAKRMFFELRDIREGKVPFVSAVPVDDNLDTVLASIEGPPETPYEKGIFWIVVKLSKRNPDSPPLMRFQTKIYHPNISPRGDICANYRENWNSVISGNSHGNSAEDFKGSWYQRKRSKTQWTLGYLLTALCGLLSTPNVDDPLVPEIAQKYLEDYDGFQENARLYTQLFATAERPFIKDLVFPEEELDLTTTSSRAADSAAASSLSSSTGPEKDTRTTQLLTPPSSIIRDDCVSIIPPSNPWAAHIDWPTLSHEWSIRERCRDDDSNLPALLMLTRDHMKTKTALVGDATDLDLTFALLEQSVQALASSNPYDDLGLNIFYSQVQQLCAAYVVGKLNSRGLRLAEDDFDAPLRYLKFHINDPQNPALNWTFNRTVEELQNLLSVTSTTLQDIQLGNIKTWCSGPASGVPRCLMKHPGRGVNYVDASISMALSRRKYTQARKSWNGPTEGGRADL
ncbi:related to ubiquitin conjugating enzyme ubc1 [Phialocephala subalpina]|uniref:Related to ubiquitin conjugating enzyme ubc1 n=1 Tax=Phialocephala subalpina TaxID=576137 RepID=A0A1L7WXQ7_9HELO|nr:related to ubiquitin conjugating enzyme ubc1 [Phialocephala subalpina]